MREEFAEMNDDELAIFMKWQLATCERPEMWGNSWQMLKIVRKS